MPHKDGGVVRSIALDALVDFRRRPLMWLILSTASLPSIFLFYFLVAGSPPSLYFVFLFVGYSLTFTVLFLFWCMAVFLYDDDIRAKGKSSYRGAYARMERAVRPSAWVGLFCGLITVLAVVIAQMVVSMILGFLATGQASDSSLIALSVINYFLSYLAADLALVLIVLVPQMVTLEGGAKLEEVLRASYQLIKERYRNAILLFIIPEIVTRAVFLGASFAIAYVPGMGLIFALLLLCMALLEGARTAFIATAFNRFYYQVLDEEKKKRRKKSRQKAKQKKR
ncbi:MAG: hypothetical protein SWK76_07905 [Actinomycetota bacterium]|nr:hypothetical protein [Actinomycetota bacterium]